MQKNICNPQDTYEKGVDVTSQWPKIEEKRVRAKKVE